MTENTGDQSEQIATQLACWLEMIDEDLLNINTPLGDRPLQALLRLMEAEAFEVQYGEEKVDLGRPFEHMGSTWFRVLYLAVERWFEKAYGAENIRGKGNPPAEGIALIRGVPVALRVPPHRSKVHKEGLEAWLYFEQGIGEGEEPLRWLVDSPDLSHLDAKHRSVVETSVTEIATALRVICFHRMGVTQNVAAERLADVARGYLESGARRIRSGRVEELGPSWFDLQMACESALKLVLLLATGSYPHIHPLPDLLSRASAHGVAFDPVKLSAWPDFRTMSDFRYNQGSAGNVARLFEAYRLAVDLVAAAMATISTPLGTGSGFLLRRPPWLTDAAHASDEGGDADGRSTD